MSEEDAEFYERIGKEAKAEVEAEERAMDWARAWAKYPGDDPQVEIGRYFLAQARQLAEAERENANLRKGLEIIAGGFEHAPSVAEVFLRDAALPDVHVAAPATEKDGGGDGR